MSTIKEQKKRLKKVQPPFIRGGYIRKKNFDFFKNWNGQYIPAIEIHSAFQWDVKNHPTEFRVNGKYIIKLENIVFITKEENDNLFKFYHSLNLSKPVGLSVDETCYTTYKGEKKEKIKEDSKHKILRTLYLFQIRRPDDKFQAYQCPNCNFYHIGKITGKELSHTFISKIIIKIKKLWDWVRN